MFRTMFAAAVVGLCLTAGPATAGPITGRQMKVQVFFDGAEFDPANLTKTFTVDPLFPTQSVELPAYGGGGSLAIDLFDTGPNAFSILFTVNTGVTYGSSSDGQNLVTFTPISASIPAFTSATIGTASPVFDDPSRVLFSANSVSFNFDSLSVVTGDTVRLDVTTAAPAAVPEPASAALLGLGGLAVAAARRRKARA
ncbi:MAG: PEP-CTERM sorting domain-containing protein [Gemmataceae bacterium]|nr:PEP-CTERM sorting domain-containing protein [Gemmataceae bacterium]